MQVVVTGASGYVGTAVQEALLAAGHTVRALSRGGRAVAGADGWAADILSDDIDAAFVGMDAVIHLVGIIREDRAHGITFEKVHVHAARRVVDAAKRSHVAHLVHMSALGTGPRAPSQYFATKWTAEQMVRGAWPSSTIVRPSLMFGGGAPFFATLKSLAKMPVVPVPGDGRALFDPVARVDVAKALTALATDRESDGGVIEIGGPRRYSLDALMDHVASVGGRRGHIPKVHMPLSGLRWAASLFEGMSSFPVTTDQLVMLNRPNITDDQSWHRLVPNPAILASDL